MTNSRKLLVATVANFCEVNNLDYRQVWNLIYDRYGEIYKIYPHIDYKFGHKSKLDFLEAYESLYKTMTKMWRLVETEILSIKNT